MTQLAEAADDGDSHRDGLRQALEHACVALVLIDEAAPNSILGIRCQHLIDELKAKLQS